MSDTSDQLLDLIVRALAATVDERGVVFYTMLFFTIGLVVAVFWPFGGTPIDVFIGYAIVLATIGSGVLLVKWFFHSIN
jgi:hypothetical protein